METKICKVCGIEKEINDFLKYKKYNKEYIRCTCKKCEYEKIKEYRKKNKDINKEKRRKYYEKNLDVFVKYREKYKEKRKEWSKKYREKNKEKIKKYQQIYHQKNKTKRNIKERIRKEEDKVYKLKINARLMIKDAFKRKNKSKTGKSENIIGCNIDFFVGHLLETYKNNYGYDWDGKEKVHIDHIIPLATANKEEEIIKLCHYTNLQLLRAEDNMRKSDKLDWRLD